MTTSIVPTVTEPDQMLTTYINFFEAAAGTLSNFANLRCVLDFLIHYMHPAMQHTTNILTRNQMELGELVLHSEARY